MEISVELWDRVDMLRGRMSIRELAEKSGLNEASLQTTRSVKTLPKLQMLYPIAQALGTSVDYLYSGHERADDFDTPLFRKLSSSQDFIDICEALVQAQPEDIELVKRILRVEKNTSVTMGEVTA